jgi:hypothetical protein
MAMFFIDTLKTVNELTNSGMDENQARTITTMLKDLMDGQFLSLATKQDLEKVSIECKAEIFEVKTEIKALKWMLGTFGVIVMVAIVQHGFVH